MRNKILMIGIIIAAIIIVAVYLFYTQGISTIVMNSQAANQLTSQASSALAQQLNQATSGISTQDILNTVNSPS